MPQTGKLFSRLLTIAVLAAGLSGCYLPIRFDAEVELNRQGFYKMIFDGYLAEVKLYDDLDKKKISRADEQKKAKVIENDFRRDRSTKDFEYIRKGHFRVKWEKEGDLFRSKMVTFFRRNENMMSIRYVKTSGLIVLEGAPISRTNAQRINDLGLTMTGELRLITNAKVAKHNADEVKDWENFQKMYIWRIKSVFEPVPKLVATIY